MAKEITIPKLGLTMVDCTLVEWMKNDGDEVAAGEVLYAVETDKISNEIEAESNGFLQRTAEIDSVHGVGSVVGFLHETKEQALSAEKPSAGDVTVEGSQPEEAGGIATTDAPPKNPVSMQAGQGSARLLISPVARAIADKAGLHAKELKREGSGPGGAVLKRDVERHLQTAVPARPSEKATDSVNSRPLKGMRKTIAKRMMESLQSTAQMTAFARVDMSGTVRLREELVAREADLGIRVTYTDFVVKAVATALSQMPGINAAIIGDEIVEWSDANVGIAVALVDGLIVPVIHRANHKSLVEIASERSALVDKARGGSLSAEDLRDGTFSVSNFGSYGGDFETPILNPPQSAMLGVGQITDEPVVRDGEIVIRPMMMLSMTFDHRLIDGADAGRFRALLRSYLENPALQMAELR
ncbi:MAG: 2-oxo acid dehydrogenase subunit E2 [Rhizobiaceae bacterium]|nr:2-oxo acid dehydrogenase subunit E2 [Rhizobiaceae bacterium]